MDFTFASFVDGSFARDPVSGKCTWLHLCNANADIGGGKLTREDVDVLAQHPEADTVVVSGLNQDTFEYLIATYGKQLRAIRFWKNKAIEDLSPLGTLPQLEYVYYFFNQRVTRLWDMSGNTALSALGLDDFSRLHTIEAVRTAPQLREFAIGDAVWPGAVIDSFMPLGGTEIERLSFSGKAISDNNFSFLSAMPRLREFDFPLNLLTTEQVAWIVANFPHLTGYALVARRDWMLLDKKLYAEKREIKEVPSTIIVGKRKPALNIAGNEARIAKYEQKFEALKELYRGKAYEEIFEIHPL